MKERILRGWTFTRVLYLVMGTYIIIQSILERQWIGIPFGGYFAAMGLFAFGCAAGNCFSGTCDKESQNISKDKLSDIEFKEVKTK